MWSSNETWSAAVLTLALLSMGCAAAPAAPCGEVTLIVRTPLALRERQDVTRLFETAQAQHVTAMAILVKEDEDPNDVETIPSGRAFYASAIAPIAEGYEGFDVLTAAIEEGHARGIDVIAWIPQFHDASAIARDATWSMGTLDAMGNVVPYVGAHGERFASPANDGARAYERSIVLEVADHYAVDGINLDWIRYDGWPTGMDDATRLPYRATYGVDPASIDFTVASDERERWRAYRAEIVASHVREIRMELDRAHADLPLGAYILSPEWGELSQDASLFASALQTASPMSYFDDWGYQPSWVWTQIVPESESRVGPSVEVTPVLDEDWTDEQNAMVLTGLRESTPYVRRISWFAYGAWDDDLVRRLAPLRICR